MSDGKRLGHIVDIVFDLPSGVIKGFVVPICGSGFGLFKQQQQAFIRFEQVCKIGEDTILVEIMPKKDNNGYILSSSKK